MRKWNLVPVLMLVCLVFLTSAQADMYYNAKLGEWVEFVPEDQGTTPADTQTDENGFVSGYVRLKQGNVLYRDIARNEPFAEPKKASIFYAIRVRVYEKGNLYELRFDTPATISEGQYSRAYFYSSSPDIVETQSAIAQIVSARVADGVVIPLVHLYYGIMPQEEGFSYNVTAASGVCWPLHDGTNIRKGPARDIYEPIAKVNRNDRLTIIGYVLRDTGATWYLVDDGQGHQGYVRADIVTVESLHPPLPDSTTPSLEPESDAPQGNQDTLKDDVEW